MNTTSISAIDPVCGMTVDPGNSRRSEHEGKSYFFCSAGCQTKFESDPEGYVGSESGEGCSERSLGDERIVLLLQWEEC